MKQNAPTLLVAKENGTIYDYPPFEAIAAKGGLFFRLTPRDLIKMPKGSELFVLPSRSPVGFNQKSGEFVTLDKYYAVAAFISPGYSATYSTAYAQKKTAQLLPLFSYAAVALYKNEFYVTALRVDRERRQDLRLMNMARLRSNVENYRKLYPKNRLIRHLEKCALVYSCPAAKNFFLSRYEAPLPTSPYCNARCIGCISYQPKKRCSITQPRIEFKPTASEVAQVALHHMERVADPVVSFGQGCEGEPLLAADVLLKSIALIRKKSSKGIINLNTNASLPKVVERLCRVGLNSIRVSLNSAQKIYYQRYYKPKNYSFSDVLESIRIAKKMGVFVSLNYLMLPGFTDSRVEFKHLQKLIKKYKIDMIQWRNLNYDPLAYFQEMKFEAKPDELIGIRCIIESIHKKYPRLLKGYFNPSRKRMSRKHAAY